MWAYVYTHIHRYIYRYLFQINLFWIESYFLDAEYEEDQTSFSHPTYGTITANIIYLNDTVFAYSAAVIFSNDTSSDSCTVLFADSSEYLIATTSFINR